MNHVTKRKLLTLPLGDAFMHISGRFTPLKTALYKYNQFPFGVILAMGKESLLILKPNAQKTISHLESALAEKQITLPKKANYSLLGNLLDADGFQERVDLIREKYLSPLEHKNHTPTASDKDSLASKKNAIVVSIDINDAFARKSAHEGLDLFENQDIANKSHRHLQIAFNALGLAFNTEEIGQAFSDASVTRMEKTDSGLKITLG